MIVCASRLRRFQAVESTLLSPGFRCGVPLWRNLHTYSIRSCCLIILSFVKNKIIHMVDLRNIESPRVMTRRNYRISLVLEAVQQLSFAASLDMTSESLGLRVAYFLVF